MGLLDLISAPGDYTRGLLGGTPGGRVTGRGLLERWGILGQNKPGFDAGDVAGFAADLITDPLTFLPFGAIFKGGKHLAKVAAKAGPGWKHSAKAAENLVGDIGSKKALQWIPPGSKHLGEGSEAVALRAPGGTVIRVEDRLAKDLADTGRLMSRDVLSPHASVNLKKTGVMGPKSYRPGEELGIQLEYLPYAQMLNKQLPSIKARRLEALKGGRGAARYQRAELRQSDKILKEKLKDFDELKQLVKIIDDAPDSAASRELADLIPDKLLYTYGRNIPRGADKRKVISLLEDEQYRAAQQLDAFEEGYKKLLSEPAADWAKRSPNYRLEGAVDSEVNRQFDKIFHGERGLRHRIKRGSGVSAADLSPDNVGFLGRRLKVVDPGYMDEIDGGIKAIYHPAINTSADYRSALSPLASALGHRAELRRKLLNQPQAISTALRNAIYGQGAISTGLAGAYGAGQLADRA